MSIATELAKLQTARNKIRTKLVALGLVTAAAKLDDCASRSRFSLVERCAGGVPLHRSDPCYD